MTCVLDLHIFDRDTLLPLDLSIAFGCSKSAWGDVIAHSPFKDLLAFHSSEQDQCSVNGVRCWFTDSIETIFALAEFLVQNQYGTPSTKSIVECAPHWISDKRRLRFILELI